MITNNQLVNKLLEYQESNQWGYLFGASGQLLTDRVYKQFLAKYTPGSDQYTNVELAWRKWKGRKVADCSGIVYRAMRDLGVSVSRFYTSSIPWQGAKQTIATTMLNVPGIILWREGHMAVMVDSAQSLPTVEARSTELGVVRDRITGRSGAAFTHWGYIKGIEYSMKDAQPRLQFLRTLRYSDEGEDVKMMQLALNQRFGAKLKGTGRFLENTLATLKAFQEYKGLVVDGICGPLTWAALGYE